MQDGAGSAATTTVEEKKEPVKGVFVSAGQPSRVDFNAEAIAKANADKQAQPAGDNGEAGKDGEKGATDDNKNNPENKDNQQGQPGATTNEPTEDQMKAYFEKQGIKFESLDKLKEKLNPAVEKTDAEKQAEAIAKEQKLLALHMKRGGTIEQFTTFKQIVAADPKELGLTKAKEDLMTEGFSSDQADLIIKKMHLQYTDEEIAELTPEQQEQLKKEAAFGMKRREARGSSIVKTAKSYLDSLEQELLDEDTESSTATKHTSKAEDVLKNVQRKQTFDLGEHDGKPLGSIEFEVPETVIAEVKAIISDYSGLKNKLINKDGSLNLEFLVPHIINSVSRETSLRHAYLDGGTKQVEAFKQTFGSKVPDLGAAKQQVGKKGELVSAGTPVLVRRSS